jgi:hypothetical protein
MKVANSGNVNLAKILRKELEKKVNERSAQIKSLLLVPPTDIIVCNWLIDLL